MQNRTAPLHKNCLILDALSHPFSILTHNRFMMYIITVKRRL